MDLSTCDLVKQSYESHLHHKHNIEGVGIGHKFVNGKDTNVPAILIFVQQKLDRDNVISKYSLDDIIPEHIDGIPTDVIEVGKIVKQAFKGRVRPIQPGFSISHANVTAGTLGGIFIDNDNDYVVLSNNHVIADENKAKLGDIILQPGKADSFGDIDFSGWNEPITNLPYFANLKDVTKLQPAGNTHDSATAKIHPAFIKNGLINMNYPEVNKPMRGFGSAKVGQAVQKFGRTTGRTKGKVMAIKSTFSVAYDFGTAKFDNCIVCSSMSSGGDSGSIILDDDMNAIALLFAGSPKVTIASPIDAVINRYGLKLPGTDSLNDIESSGWSTIGSGITRSKRKATIVAPANEASYLESTVPTFNEISIKVNTGDDKGACWGPGACISWAGGFLKLNFRYTMTYGCTDHHSEHLGIGKTLPNHEYTIIFRLDKSGLLSGEINDGTKTYLMERIQTTPGQYKIRVGKMDQNASYSHYQVKGDIGTSHYSGLSVV